MFYFKSAAVFFVEPIDCETFPLGEFVTNGFGGVGSSDSVFSDNADIVPTSFSSGAFSDAPGIVPTAGCRLTGSVPHSTAGRL